MSKHTTFGRALRSEFLLQEDFVPLNHGSFGTCPRSIHPLRTEWQRQSELNPDHFFRHFVHIQLAKTRERLARFIHCDADELAILINTTAGINAVVRSLKFKPGDKVICASTLYNAIERTMAFVQDSQSVQLVKVDLVYPLSDQQVVDAFKETIEHERAKDPNVPIRMAVFDAISSVPGVRCPFEALIKLCKEYEILSLVDGAHAIGQIPLDLHECDPDFFITNCHKWLHAPRGAALLYTPRRNHSLIHPGNINYAYKDYSQCSDEAEVTAAYQLEFGWPGTMDFSSFLCIEAALDFRESLGGEEAIQSYCNDLARKGGELVASKWGTEILENDEKTLTVAMVNVRLPFSNKGNLPDRQISKAFLEKLNDEHHTLGQPFKHNGHWYMRLSAQVYNDQSDFEHMAEAGLKVCQDLDATTSYQGRWTIG